MKKNQQTPNGFILQIPKSYTSRSGFWSRRPKVEKIVEEWDKKGYRLHSMTPVSSWWFGDKVVGYALNFHKVEGNTK